MSKPPAPWSYDHWQQLEFATCRRALQAGSNSKAWEILSKEARSVLRSYSTSFFIVTRFLPPIKRAQVEAIYAAVRYPDEMVDTFPLTSQERHKLLDDWQLQYEVALSIPSLQERLKAGIPCFVAGFAQVVCNAGIPPEHYISFLEAMRRDVSPRPFATLEDLIDSYIYGSAIVVGYFLAYVYGPATGTHHGPDFRRALQASRDLGIALQLTNFLRDVAEDQKRGRVYLPQDMLQAEGLDTPDTTDQRQQGAFHRILKKLTRISENYYAAAFANLDAFAPDCRTAIHACIDVYRQLNRQIELSPRGILHRESVPIRRKFQVLPTSKYWRLPIAYLAQ
ncbi:MAG TPA: phytoene/squalene synthase family protein [Blastocatellia bacterium]|nr:phytoene/squalene synthase family protein [Blastocatellia bacterium]